MSPLIRFAQIISDHEVPLPRATVDSASVGNILQIVFALAGGIALIIITLAGLRFVVANGDPQTVAKAKNTIIYAVLGLVVSLSAYSIVAFYMGRVPG